MAQLECVPNTLLFYGPSGVGKSLFALALAELLMGSKHRSKLTTHTHPDFHIYRPEGKASIHPIENMRKLIEEMVLPPFEARVKVFVIHDADQLPASSSNILLKTLEEPTLDSYFILLTSNLDAMLPTIVSRSRKVPFFPIPQSQTESLIKEKWQKTPEEARRIAFLSHGSLAKAEILAHHNQFPWRAQLLELLTLHLPHDYPQFPKLAAELEKSFTVEIEEGEEGGTSILNFADALFEEILAWHRDLHLLKEDIAPEYLYHLDSIDRLKLALSQPLQPLEKILDKIARSRLALQRNVKLQNVLEHFFLN